MMNLMLLPPPTFPPPTSTGGPHAQPLMNMFSPDLATSSLDAAEWELIAYIQKRSADLPPDMQKRVHNASRKESKRVIKAQVLGEARTAYEEAFLASLERRTGRTLRPRKRGRRAASERVAEEA